MFVQCGGAKHSPSHIHFKSTKGGKGTLQRKSVLLGTFKELRKSFCLLCSERFLLIFEQTESFKCVEYELLNRSFDHSPPQVSEIFQEK